MVRRYGEKFVFDAGDEEDSEDQVAVGGGGGGDEDDDDDEEANEDLSLKILQKALSRRAIESSRNEVDFDDSNETSMADLCASSSGVARFAVVNGEKSEILKEDKVKLKKKNMNIEVDPGQENSIVTKDEEGVGMVVEVSEDEKAEVYSTREVEKPLEPNTVETSSNMVLRKLLRGPRYFDPPDCGWDSCYNCGEQGHMAVNCPSFTKRKKPCFVCGSLEHAAKQCAKAQDCFICKRGGHRAKDCPDKYKSGSNSTTICLKCGDPGHDMFSCKYEYSQDDLKDIQCYVCKRFGHLCCVNPFDNSRWILSCYRCGQPGHIGQACGRLNEEGIGKESPSSCFRCGGGGHFARECPNSSGISFSQSRDSPSLCYKCGEGGHFARECTSSTRIRKRNREMSTPSRKPHRKHKEYSGYNSAPYEPDGKLKRKKAHNEGRGLTAPRKPKHRGGWIMDDPEEEDSSQRRIKNRKPRSPSTPSSKNHRIPPLNFGGRFSGSPSSRRPPSSHPIYSASRFGNGQYDEFRRTNNDRW